MISKFVGFFRKPWVLSLVGLLALLALIWYASPLLGFGKRPTHYPLEGVRTRLAIMAVVTLLWFARTLWRWFAAMRANAQMLQGLAAGAKPKEKQISATERESKQQVDELRQRMEEAIGVLKKAKVGSTWGQQYVYQLPWYIMIGAPGSGKTTALINSGIKFPLEQRLGKGAIKGVGGTRDCDWLFTDEAVLLDTAGRYTTHDSDPTVDAAAWKGFLDLLKKYRRRRPINGVLVGVSVADLLLQSSAERQAHAAQLKGRIQELHTHFGIRFPVYVLFTKCDLLPGFNDFFAQYGREEREQVWGMTFPLDDTSNIADVLPTYAANFAALERRLHDRLVDRAQQERDVQRRAGIYVFPLNFAALKDVTERFLNEIFQSTKFEERIMLRGVYFTSGTQEGTPIDRLMSSIANAFAVERSAVSAPVGAGKSYFITRLLRDVVFREAGLAGTNLKLERKRRWLQGAAYAAAALVTVLAGFAWLTSYERNRTYVSGVRDNAQQIKKQLHNVSADQSQVVSLLPILDAVKTIPGGYADQDKGTPWSMGLGLYQGDKLGSAATDAYHRTLERVLLPNIARRLEQQIREGGSNLDFLFEALRVYLMLGDEKHFDAQSIVGWLDFDWEQRPQEISADQRQKLALHATALFERGFPAGGVALDQSVVEQARNALLSMPLAQRVYNQLKRAPDVQALPELRLSDVSGRESALVFMRKSGTSWAKGVPGLFTFDGYHKTFKDKIDKASEEAAEESWILGPEAKAEGADKTKISDEVRRLYLEEYNKQWDRVLADITVMPFTDMNRAALVLNVLSNPSDSPLKKLMEAIKRETRLRKPPEGAVETTVAQVQGGIDTAREKIASRIGRIMGGQAPAAAATGTKAPEHIVDDHFARLHEFVEGGGKEGGAPLDKTITLLNDLNAYLGAVVSAIQSGQRPPPPTPQNAQTLQQIRLEAPRSPVPVSGVMSRVADGTRAILVGGSDSLVNSDWRGNVLPLCRQGIMGRYPFARGATQEVTREDFGQFFASGGTVDAFFQRNLKDLVDTNRDPWQVRSFDGTRLPLSGAGLASLQNAAKVREVFFRAGGQNPSLSFELKPVTMDAEVTKFMLDVDGQILRYDHGPQMAIPMRWPGPKGTGQVNLEYEPPGASGRKAMSEDGPWALFRLFDKARMQGTKDPARFEITFDLDGRSITLELRASSVVNPFRFTALERFQCPESL